MSRTKPGWTTALDDNDYHTLMCLVGMNLALSTISVDDAAKFLKMPPELTVEVTNSEMARKLGQTMLSRVIQHLCDTGWIRLRWIEHFCQHYRTEELQDLDAHETKKETPA